jgi:hypothetical protein
MGMTRKGSQVQVLYGPPNFLGKWANLSEAILFFPECEQLGEQFE